MTRTITLLTAAVLSAAPGLVAGAAPRRAKAMLDKAVAHYKEVGRKQALADFNAKKAPFFDRDLYVFCLAPDHRVANGEYPSAVGASADALKDADGKPLGKTLWDAGARARARKVPMVQPRLNRSSPRSRSCRGRRRPVQRRGLHSVGARM